MRIRLSPPTSRHVRYRQTVSSTRHLHLIMPLTCGNAAMEAGSTTDSSADSIQDLRTWRGGRKISVGCCAVA